MLRILRRFVKIVIIHLIKANGGQAYIDLQAVKAWDGKLPDTIMGNGSLPFVNVGK